MSLISTPDRFYPLRNRAILALRRSQGLFPRKAAKLLDLARRDALPRSIPQWAICTLLRAFWSRPADALAVGRASLALLLCSSAALGEHSLNPGTAVSVTQESGVQATSTLPSLAQPAEETPAKSQAATPSDQPHSLPLLICDATLDASAGSSAPRASAPAENSEKARSYWGETDGFTPIAPSPDSRIIYVSSSEGDDGNSALTESAPCKTLAAAFSKVRAGHPDHVFLKRGDVWRNQSLEKVQSGRSRTEPAVVAFYGDEGARPRIENSDRIFRLAKRRIEYVAFIGLELASHRLDPDDPEFTGEHSDKSEFTFLGGMRSILIEDMRFRFLGLTIQDIGSERPSGFVVRRNIFAGTYYSKSSYVMKKRPSNLFAKGVDGLLIEENVFDFGGWHPTVKGAGANSRNHNVYLQRGSDGNRTLFSNNIVSRGSSHGLQMRSGGIVRDNFFGRNAIGFLVGTAKKGGIPAGTRAHAIDNVVSEGRSMYKGVDCCSSRAVACTSALFAGTLGDAGDCTDWVCQGNIACRIAEDEPDVERRTRRGFSFPEAKLASGVIKPAGNISYQWKSDSEGVGEGYKDPGRTLGDYFQSIGGPNSYDAFMEVVKNRPLQTWNESLSAKAANAHIREGFEK